MNPNLSLLKPYPFERLRVLLANSKPNKDLKLIGLQIGEPRHPAPHFVEQALIDHMKGLGAYPLTAGSHELRAAIAAWLTRRFKLPTDSLDPDSMVLPVNGTREALFAFAQAAIALLSDDVHYLKLSESAQRTKRARTADSIAGFYEAALS